MKTTGSNGEFCSRYSLHVIVDIGVPFSLIFIYQYISQMFQILKFQWVKYFLKLNYLYYCLGFQFTYTTLFGIYAAFLFVRTGHIIAPCIAHSYCNFIGFPDFGEIVHRRGYQRIILIVAYVSGLLGWCFLLMPLTTPSLYNNDIVSWSREYEKKGTATNSSIGNAYKIFWRTNELLWWIKYSPVTFHFFENFTALCYSL